MLPVPPNVAPAISLELDVDDGEVENYEVEPAAVALSHVSCSLKILHLRIIFCSKPSGPVEPRGASRRGQAQRSN